MADENKEPAGGEEGQGTILGAGNDEGTVLTDPQDNKPDDNKPDDNKPDGNKPDGAPYEYEDFSLPEGVELDKESLSSFIPVAKELDLSQDKAQKLVDLFSENMRERAEKGQEELKQLQEGWKKTIDELPDKKNVISSAKKALRFADEATRELFTTSWIGNHPGIIKMLSKIGDKLNEDRVVDGGQAKGRDVPLEYRLYPNMK